MSLADAEVPPRRKSRSFDEDRNRRPSLKSLGNNSREMVQRPRIASLQQGQHPLVDMAAIGLDIGKWGAGEQAALGPGLGRRAAACEARAAMHLTEDVVKRLCKTDPATVEHFHIHWVHVDRVRPTSLLPSQAHADSN